MNKFFICTSFLAFCFASLSYSVPEKNSEASFSITFKNSSKGTVTVNGKSNKLTRGFLSKKQKAILIAIDGASGDKPNGDNISLSIDGETSGDYKFDFNPKTDKSHKGHAFLQLNPTTAAATKLGYLYSTSGVLHLTVTANSCSGTIEAKTTSNCSVTGSFSNIPLQEKN